MTKFNNEQIEVIKHGDTPLQVISSAGSGKSTVLIARIIKKVMMGANNICAITFTRNTANDLQKKLKLAKVLNKVEVGTFHSIMGKILKSEGYNVSKRLKDYEIENLFKKIIKQEDVVVDTNDIMSFISFQKNNLIYEDDDFIEKESNYTIDELRECYKEYEKLKKDNKAYDFDDYLLLGYEILKKNPNKHIYDYILVDEAQDCNELQFRLIKLLCPSKKITIVGDAQQCIYEFRASNPKLFMDFYKSYEDTRVINMNINYRSNDEIVKKSNNFIKKYFGDYKYYKDAEANKKEESHIELFVNQNEEDESEEVVEKIKTLFGLGYSGSDIGVLYRNNIQSQQLENKLKENGIDYFIEKNGGFFDRREILIVMCILRLIDNNNDDSAYEQLFKLRCNPFKFLSNDLKNDISNLSIRNNISYFNASKIIHCMPWQKTKLSWFTNFIERLSVQNSNGVNLLTLINNIINGINLEEYINLNYPKEEDRQERLKSIENLKKFIKNNTLDSFLKFVYETNSSKDNKNSKEKIQLMSIHKSKGLEFKVVILLGMKDGTFPSKKANFSEEVNVFYVAITRPIERLYVSQIGSKNVFAKEYFGKSYDRLISELL